MFIVVGRCDPADMQSIQNVCHEQSATIDDESLEGHQAKLSLYVPVFKTEYEPFSKARNDLVEQWLAPYVQKVKALGMVDVSVRINGPAGGNPWIGGKSPTGAVDRIMGVLHPILLDPPVIHCAVPKTSRKKKPPSSSN